MIEELKINDEYEVKIEKQDHFGNGLVRVKNMLVFVKKALPDDLCKIEITNVKKTFASAKIKELISPSSIRVEAKCPYYDRCGGCHIMHEEYNEQLKFKERKLKELLKKFTSLDDINIYPIVSKKQFYYRNKVIFHGENNQLGFYQEKTNSIVPIKTCMITNQRLNAVYQEIQRYLSKNIHEQVESVLLRITSLNEILVVLEGNINEDKILPYLDNVSTIYLNNKLIRGNSYIEEEIFDIKFKIYPSSFFQVNYEMMLILYRIVMNFYKDKNYNKVLDLYCGTGTIGMLVSSYVNEVIGVEIESSSIKSANLCKEINNISNISFIEGKVEDEIDLFKDVDSIIVDPPRSGLDNHTLETVMKLSPKTITYISCDPVTMSRDLKVLVNDYNVLEVHPVDMFPNTYHVECVCILSRK